MRIRCFKNRFSWFSPFRRRYSTTPDKVKCITEFPKPSTLTQLRRFLGLFNFYRCFIPKAAHLLAPLIQFLEGHKNKRKPVLLFPNQPNNYNGMTQPMQPFV
ncbi:transposon Ty3-I Gag-Pol polyprotein [Trichonephila clavipes]|nr:transposon Ty3-I Gag-Pol polyprotein [Trichonephila clavipes]